MIQPAITPTFARNLLRHFTDGRPRFPGLRNLALCTMAAPEALRREIRRRITPNLVIYYATNESWYLTVADAKAQSEFPETVGFAVEGIEIQIVDEGQGIPEATRDKLFTPFFTTKDRGLGLGLALCHRIVEEHKGAIQVTSEPGRGTAVSCFLPIAK